MRFTTKTTRNHRGLAIKLPICLTLAFTIHVLVLAQPRTSLIKTLEMPEPWADSLLATLSTREKIGQLMMVAAYSNKSGSAHVAEIADLVARQKVGGIIFFQGTAAKQAELTNYYQSLSTIPLLIGMDAEWGVGMRLDSVPNFPFQIALGALQNDSLIYRMGVEIAKQFKQLGMHINFAPVADVNSNPENPVINARSFGEDPQAVARKCVAYTNGLQDNGVIACAKHFPGHGNTDKDSHSELPTLHSSRRTFEQVDLFPFRKLIDNGIGSVMVGHLSVPRLDASGQMSSLSQKLSGNLLRKKLNFKGLLFSDGMQMQAVSQRYSYTEANLKALLAGSDMLIYPLNVELSIDLIEEAVNSGLFPVELLNQKCLRVLKAKRWLGLSGGSQPVDVANLSRRLFPQSAQRLRAQLIESAITIAADKNSFLPIKRLDTLRIAYIEVSKNNRNNTFLRVARRYASLNLYKVDQTNPADYDSLMQKLHDYNLVIVGYMDINQRAPQRNFDLDKSFCRWLTQLAMSKRTVLALYANPYVMPKIDSSQKFESVLLAYNNESEYQRAAAHALFGANPVLGKSSVAVPKYIKVGEGVQKPARTRLKYGTPLELSIAPERLTAVDSMALNAISMQAFPGCQVLAAHKGVIFYHKAFGYHTYRNEDRVALSDLYDMASVTKITATLPVIMKMEENKDIGLNDMIGKYIALDQSSDKAKLVVRDILLHQSGLKAWIPIHVAFLRPVFADQPLLSVSQSETHPFKLYSHTYLNKFHTLDTAFFSSECRPDYPFPVADSIYAHSAIREKVYQLIDNSPLLENRYRYSDLGFYYMQRVIESVSGKGLDVMADSLFYSPLGMKSTAYFPLQKFDRTRIAPTEWEYSFRRQLIHGYVHDHGAATVGGVAGHAGLFSTTYDMAKMMQMFLWRGSYGGTQLLKPETVDKFTSRSAAGNRRGLGFDKPELNPQKASPVCPEASPESFGHSGFTGTFVWVDPQRELVYIFLSNRVHPDSNNNLITTTGIRTNMLREFI
ncbi:MAG: serine hydrolase, partial [Prevotellaceae bacterium]|nr:serine hydrolase [Prevotellaceae bacterium]